MTRIPYPFPSDANVLQEAAEAELAKKTGLSKKAIQSMTTAFALRIVGEQPTGVTIGNDWQTLVLNTLPDDEDVGAWMHHGIAVISAVFKASQIPDLPEGWMEHALGQWRQAKIEACRVLDPSYEEPPLNARHLAAARAQTIATRFYLEHTERRTLTVASVGAHLLPFVSEIVEGVDATLEDAGEDVWLLTIPTELDQHTIDLIGDLALRHNYRVLSVDRQDNRGRFATRCT